MSEHGYGAWQAADGGWYPPEQHPDHDPNDNMSYGWWQAADGNRYPPSQHPDYRGAADAVRATVAMTPPSPSPAPPPMASPPPPAASIGASGSGLALTPAVIAVLVTALLIAIGSVLPWATIDLGFISESIGGLDGDGGITLGLAVVMAVLAFLSKGRKTAIAIAAVVCAALCALIAVIDISDVSSTFDGSGLGGGVSVGYGLWLVLIASLAAVGACIKLILDSRKS